MPKKSSPLLQKVSSLVKDSILIVKMQKPSIPKLIVSLKKSKKLKKLMFRKHYNYKYIQEYQFSPSNTPLIQYYKQPLKKRSYQDLYSMFFMCTCLGMSQNDVQDRRYPMVKMALPTNDNAVMERDFVCDWGSEDDSVDEKAEKFIEKFYEEMRKQRQEALSRVNSLQEL
ncbi:hypothetical protein LIER_01008 [Lithospermum erythrorhizon]|uniref:Cotton fiber protein n=1 Tax=Lithospermum erythrorhizon TaxID=34254 RepID=A0AAV3NNY3_LITER